VDEGQWEIERDAGCGAIAIDAAIYRDLTGDARDEIVVWDQNRVWIYTQDRPFSGKRIYAPRRTPDYNESNYRITVSLPGWKDIN